MGEYGTVGLPSCRLSLGEDATGATHVRRDKVLFGSSALGSQYSGFFTPGMLHAPAWLL